MFTYLSSTDVLYQLHSFFMYLPSSYLPCGLLHHVHVHFTHLLYKPMSCIKSLSVDSVVHLSYFKWLHWQTQHGRLKIPKQWRATHRMIHLPSFSSVGGWHHLLPLSQEKYCPSACIQPHCMVRTVGGAILSKECDVGRNLLLVCGEHTGLLYFGQNCTTLPTPTPTPCLYQNQAPASWDLWTVIRPAGKNLPWDHIPHRPAAI